MKLDWLHWILIALLLIGGTTFWFSPYRYERWLGGGLVRIHRVTGEAEILLRTGWRPMVETKKPIKTQGWTLDEAPNTEVTK